MALLTLPETRTLLNISGNSRDSEILDDIEAAEAVVVHFCGPVDEQAVTDVVDLTGTALVLSTTPVLELTSVTGDLSGVMTLSRFRVKESSGVIRPKAGYAWPLCEDTFTVVYTAGRSEPDKLLKQAVRVIVKHLWQMRLGSGRRGSGDGDTTMIPELGYAVPNRAIELMKPRMKGPASA